MSVHAACIAVVFALYMAAPAWGQPSGWPGENRAMQNGAFPDPAAPFASGTTGAPSCVAAATAAERRYAVPRGLMLAIGDVETGRHDPRSGRTVPWPWSVNTGTDGRYFASKAQAVAWVRKAQAMGVVSIDVGCMQVNLQAHPHAFTSLEDAFDPKQNADYAARFLVRLHEESGSWEKATAEYHSHTPALGIPYRKQVALAAAALTRQLPRTRLQILQDAWAATLPRGNTMTSAGGYSAAFMQPAPPRTDLAQSNGTEQPGEL